MPRNHLTINQLLAKLGRVDLPNQWVGGEIDKVQREKCRRFTNEKQGLRVVYHLSNDDTGVKLQKISRDSSPGSYDTYKTLTTDKKPQTDKEKFIVALGMMSGSKV